MSLLMNLGRWMLATVGKLKDTKSGGCPLESRRPLGGVEEEMTTAAQGRDRDQN